MLDYKYNWKSTEIEGFDRFPDQPITEIMSSRAGWAGDCWAPVHISGSVLIGERHGAIQATKKEAKGRFIPLAILHDTNKSHSNDEHGTRTNPMPYPQNEPSQLII